MKFKKHTVKNKYGWSEWVYPTKKYLFKCCDCNLIHELEFATFVESKRQRDTFEVIKLPNPIRTMFRARRYKK